MKISTRRAIVAIAALFAAMSPRIATAGLLFHDTSEAPTGEYTAEQLTDLTSPSGNFYLSSILNQYNGAFDNDVPGNPVSSSRWLSGNVSTAYAYYDFGAGNADIIDAYAIYPVSAGYYEAVRNPKNFEFYGTMDDPASAGAEWTLLGSESNASMTSRIQAGFWSRYVYSTTNTTAYRAYKLVFTAAAGSDGTARYAVQELELYHIFALPGAPSMKEASVAAASGSLVLSAAAECVSSFDAFAVINDGATTVTNLIGQKDGDCTVEYAIPASFTGTCAAAILATNAIGESISRATTFYGGTPALAFVSNAYEKGSARGLVTVSRENADPFPLAVSYTFTGTGAHPAVEGVNYEAPAGTVTIPSGSASAVIEITPKYGAPANADTTLEVNLAGGAYFSAGADGVAMTIVNDETPAGYRTWVASGPGKASDAGNWSPSASVSPADHILFDGQFSAADCEWDSPAEVASWTQGNGYTGTVRIATTYPSFSETFTNFTVTGDASIESGTLAGMKNGEQTTTSKYKLTMTVGGDLTIGEHGALSVEGCGLWSVGQRVCHAGYGAEDPESGDNASVNAPYGNPLWPTALGTGSRSGTDAANKKGWGGGAIDVLVTGDLVNDGLVTAKGGAVYAGGGTGGSILIRAANISGDGSFNASGVECAGKTDGTGTGASGGRVALIASGSNGIAASNINVNGFHETWGNKCAGGTVYLKSPGINQLSVRNYPHRGQDGETWMAHNTYLNKAYVPIPAADDPNDWLGGLKGLTLYGDICGRMRVTRELSLAELRINIRHTSVVESQVTYYRNHAPTLDLNGQTVSVSRAFLELDDGATVERVRLPPGTYTAANKNDFPGYDLTWLTDSSATEGTDGEGALIVGKYNGTLIMLR